MLEDESVSAFYDGKYDVLLSTTIIESGLDIPTANTLVVDRSDMFGLAQLYQLRGRMGRSKTRAYALFTPPVGRSLTAQAERRLKVLQSLDTLGAGFQLASHDLDIRGAGNLLGEEQSGHIKEVGFELYQQMLEEAVASLKAGVMEPWSPIRWSPQNPPSAYAGADPGGLRGGSRGALSTSTGASPTSRTSARIDGLGAEMVHSPARCRRGPGAPARDRGGEGAVPARQSWPRIDAGPKGAP